MAQAMGKGKAELSNKDVEVFIKKGAVAAAKDDALACARAKASDTSATCEDLYAKFKATTQKAKPTDKKKLMADTVTELAKSHREVCFEESTKEKAKTCLANLKSEVDMVASEFLGGDKKDGGKTLENRKKQVERKATVSYLG